MNAARRWPIALGLVLALTIGANVLVYHLATRRDALAMEPDYYRKAVAWDSTQAVAARSRALGWRLTATLAGSATGPARFVATLSDRAGAAVAGARVRVEIFAVARADERRDTVLAEVEPGRYALALPAVPAEWHEVRLSADRASERYVQRLRCLPGAGPCWTL
jgi:hypothetical protein